MLAMGEATSSCRTQGENACCVDVPTTATRPGGPPLDAQRAATPLHLYTPLASASKSPTAHAAVYRVPPRTSAAGYKAAEWDVEQFLWKGRLRVVEVGSRCDIKLEVRLCHDGELGVWRPLEGWSTMRMGRPTPSNDRYWRRVASSPHGPFCHDSLQLTSPRSRV